MYAMLLPQLMRNKDWTALGLKIDQYRLQIRTEEQAVLRELKDRVCKDFGNELEQQGTLTFQNRFCNVFPFFEPMALF